MHVDSFVVNDANEKLSLLTCTHLVSFTGTSKLPIYISLPLSLVTYVSGKRMVTGTRAGSRMKT